MSDSGQADSDLVDRIRSGDKDAWSDLIARYEGRLLAFAESRLGRGQAGEDIVQETFVGFLNSLPNYDGDRPLEGYLFSICAHKMTDYLRREGRRPAIPFSGTGDNDDSPWQIPGSARGASSIVRGTERRELEESALAAALRSQIESWRTKGEWTKVKCAELLFVGGIANKDVAAKLELSEQQVANYKFDFLARLRAAIRKQSLSSDVFPELYE